MTQAELHQVGPEPDVVATGELDEQGQVGIRERGELVLEHRQLRSGSAIARGSPGGRIRRSREASIASRAHGVRGTAGA